MTRHAPDIRSTRVVIVGVHRSLPTISLALLTALGLFVGIWAYAFPEGFFTSFPGILGHWVSTDGPYNEHLVRDVGAMYLALVAAGAAGLVWRTPATLRVMGVAWTAFGALHLAYHLGHLDHLASTQDVVGTVVSLAVSVLLGIVLLITAPGGGRIVR